MDEDRAAALSRLAETYARQVAGFDTVVDQIRRVHLGDAPLNLENLGADVDPRD